jgi:hypothetical protein
VRNKKVLHRVKEYRNILNTRKIKKKKANLISHILCRNCLLKFVTKVKTKEVTVVTERRGRRRKQLKSETGSTGLQSVENSL